MIDFIKKIFTKKDIDGDSSDLERVFLNEELEKINHFNIEKMSIILKHIKGIINLNKTDTFLTKDEKEKLGINTRLKVSKKLIEIFNTETLKNENPKELLQELYFRITFKIRKIEEIKKIKKIGITKVKLLSSGDEKTCKWCLDMDNEIIDVSKKDVIQLIKDNCKCKYNRSAIIAEISVI